MDGKKFFPSQIPQIAGLGGDYHLFKELQCSACGSERRNFSPVSPTTLSSQLNGELAGQAQAPDRGVGVSKVFQEVGRWQTVGKESLCRLRGQQLYDTTRCGVWQGVVSAVGRAGTQHMERIFLKESSLPPFLWRVEEWGPSMLQHSTWIGKSFAVGMAPWMNENVFREPRCNARGMRNPLVIGFAQRKGLAVINRYLTPSR